MSFTFAIHPEYNDIVISSEGTPVLVYGAEQVRQRVLIALRHYWQEYFLNIPGGVPWYELILGSKDKRQAELLLRSIILQVPDVLGIIHFRLFYNQNNSRQVEIYARLEVSGLYSPQIIDITSTMIMGAA